MMIRDFFERRRAAAAAKSLSPAAKGFLLEHGERLLAGWGFDDQGKWYPPSEIEKHGKR